MRKRTNQLEIKNNLYLKTVITIFVLAIILYLSPTFNVSMTFGTTAENQTNFNNQNENSSNSNQCLLTNASLPLCNNLGYAGQVNSGNNTLADGENANIQGGNNFIGQGS
ncbi:MAG: hypothetical protein M3162_07220 [Thermoproteota archaeon]|nr:hypothetical protein [Thermoproteota archaeon]